MKDSLIQQIIAQLALPEISKVDPNLQQIPDIEDYTVLQKLTQASVPSVLLGIANITIDENEEPEKYKAAGRSLDMQLIFPQNYDRIVHSVAAYAGASVQETRSFLEQIAATAESVVLEHLGTDASILQMRDHVIGEKHKIFFYLPPQLHIGALTGDPSQDDRTKKMEGPFSNIVHKVEDNLSKPE